MNIAVYCGSSNALCSCFSKSADELGTWIARFGHTLVYGGSSMGLMGDISAATMRAGGKVIGVEPAFFIEAGEAQHEISELIVVDTITQRKAKIQELADAFVALPGGVGTLEEVSEIMSCIRLKSYAGPVFFLNQEDFYRGLKMQVESMFRQGFIDGREIELFRFCESVDELSAELARLDAEREAAVGSVR